MAHLGSWELDLDDNRLTWSDEVYRIFGLRPEEFGATYEAFLERVHPDDRAAVDGAYTGSLSENRDSYAIEHRVVRANSGEIRSVQEQCRHIRDASGRAMRSVGTVHDVTDRRHAEEELHESEQTQRELLESADVSERRYRALYENSLAGMFETSTDGRLLSANEAVAEILGYASPEQMMSQVKNVATDLYVDPEDRRRVPRHVRNKGTAQQEVHVRRRDGSHGWIVLTMRAVRSSEGGIVRYEGTAIDITERKRTEQALQRIATTLQENLVHPLPTIAGLELACLSLPAHRPELLGGDFHDVFWVADDRVVVLIGDVMGKGVKAAGLTETVHSAVRALALVTASPAKVLRHVNRLLLAEEYEQFVSALVLLLDPTTGCCRLASAGHPPPVVVSDGEAHLLEPRYGPPLGTFESSYAAREFDLAIDETLVLYTDGLTEARGNGELFGEERLLNALRGARDRHPQALVEHLRTAVLAYAGTLRDDLEILALRRTGRSG